MVEFRNPKYADPVDADNRRIDCEIYHNDYGWIPYTLDDNDTDQTVDNVSLKEGIMSGSVADYTPPSDENLSSAVRMERDYILVREVDPIITNPLRWDDLTTNEQNAWKQYRTDLLNITDQAGFPRNVTWPTKPE